VSRVHLLEASEAPLRSRARFEGGPPGAIVASLAHVPELLEAVSPFLRAIYGPSAVAPRVKEILVLRVSARMVCRFCVHTHSAIARGAGLTRHEVLGLRATDVPSGCFEAPRELAVVRYAEALASASDPVPDAVMEELAAHFAEHEIVELTMIGAATIMLNRYCTALQLPASASTLDALARDSLL